MSHLSSKHLTILKTIFSDYPGLFFAFGSRAKRTHKAFSDLDLCYKTDISDIKIADLQEKLEQSDLPFKVDIVSWKRCSPAFQKQIERDLMPLENL